MSFDKALVAGKLRRWETYLKHYRLPDWEQIPDLGLYMEQVIALLRQYLDYLPPELKDEEFITAAAINNYVRTKIMPEPIKKRYYRIHIAYLLVICTMKQGLSIALIQKLLPAGLPEDQVRTIYDSYAERRSVRRRCRSCCRTARACRLLLYRDGARGSRADSRSRGNHPIFHRPDGGADHLRRHHRRAVPSAGGKADAAGRQGSGHRRNH